MKRKLLLCLLMGVMCFSLVGCGKSELEEAKKDLQETKEKYGFVEKEKVDILVGKFNTEVMDNDASSLNPASEDYLNENNNQYWYGLITGIYLVVVPEEYVGDKTTEDVDYMTIYVQKNSQYAEDSLKYVKHLIKANNNELTDTEIDNLITDAKEKSKTSTEGAYNGSGILVGYGEDEETYQYQVNRMYE